MCSCESFILWIQFPSLIKNNLTLLPKIQKISVKEIKIIFFNVQVKRDIFIQTINFPLPGKFSLGCREKWRYFLPPKKKSQKNENDTLNRESKIPQRRDEMRWELLKVFPSRFGRTCDLNFCEDEKLWFFFAACEKLLKSHSTVVH